MKQLKLNTVSEHTFKYKLFFFVNIQLLINFMFLVCEGIITFNTYEEVHKHFVVLCVYLQDMKYTLISQEPKTELFTLIAYIGGILGVFLGISFLSFIEIFEIFYEIFLIFIFNK